MKGIFIVILLILPFSICAQTIVTFAGGGTGSVGLGGPATAAIIHDPNGGVFDKYGNFYFAQDEDHIISKVDIHGIITTIAGTTVPGYNGDGIAATAAMLNFPTDVKFDTFGNLYIADHQNCRIRKVDINTGIITTIAGTGAHGFYGDGGLATNAILNYAGYICFDTYGNLYISDGINHRIRVVNSAGIISTYAGVGSSGFSGDGGPATAAEFSPGAICTDTANNLYICDYSIGENRIAKVFYSTGLIYTYAGTDTGGNYNGDGIPATAANIAPNGIAIDSFNNLYIADGANNRIRKIDAAGVIHTFAGTGTAGFAGDGGSATSAEFNQPEGLSFDICSNLYACDINNARVRKIIIDPSCSIDSLESLDVNKVAANTEVSIYPNPAYNELTISANNKVKEVTVCNVVGEVVYSQTYDIEKAEVNVAGLPAGVYVVRVTGGDGNVVVRKVVKE